MARVTPEEVLAIIDDTTLASTALDPFITAANLLVTRVVAPDTSVTEAELKELERWLAAHFVSIRDPRIIREKLGESEAQYESVIQYNKVGLVTTAYGRQALVMDPTGRLASVGKRKAFVEHIG